LENAVAAGDLQLLHQIAGPAAKDAGPGLDHGMADGAQDLGLAMSPIRARVAPNLRNGGDKIAAALWPAACGQSLPPGAWQGWQGLEVEGRQGFAIRELRRDQVARGKRRMSRPAGCYCAMTARKLAAGQLSVSARAAISAQSLCKPGRRQPRSACRARKPKAVSVKSAVRWFCGTPPGDQSAWLAGCRPWP